MVGAGRSQTVIWREQGQLVKLGTIISLALKITKSSMHKGASAASLRLRSTGDATHTAKKRVGMPRSHIAICAYATAHI